jgi:hypothetical protein
MQLFDRARWYPPPQRIGAVLWISFLMAAVADGVFFSTIDPLDLRSCVDFPEVSRMAAYTIGFFLFWLLTGATSLIAVFFVYPPEHYAARSDSQS